MTLHPSDPRCIRRVHPCDGTRRCPVGSAGSGCTHLSGQSSDCGCAVLRDGRTALVRPLRRDDRTQVEALFARLSPESRALRFHSAGVRVTQAMLDLVTSGHVLLAEQDDRLVALASYTRLTDPTRAEVAVTIDDAVQRQGIGTILVAQLVCDARREGLRSLLAEVLVVNRGMLALLEGLGLPLSRRYAGDVVEIVVELRHDPAATAA